MSGHPIAGMWVLAVRTTMAPGTSTESFRRRLVLGAAVAIAASIAGTIFLGSREPTGGVGVDVVVAIFGVFMVASLLGCVAEFASLSQSTMARWLRVMPVSARYVSLLARAPFVTACGAYVLLSTMPLAAYLHTLVGGSFVESIATSLVCSISGFFVAPIIVWVAQRLSRTGRLHNYYPGLLVLAWMAMTAAGGIVFRSTLNDGAVPALDQPVSWLLIWPAIARVVFVGGWVAWIVALAVVGIAAALAMFTLKFLWLAPDLYAIPELRREREFRRSPLVEFNLIRSWRSRRTRSYLTASIVFVAVLALLASRVESVADGAETGIFVVAIFLGGMATVRRGLSGPQPAEVRLFVEIRSWTSGVLVANTLVAVLAGAAAGVLLGIQVGRPSIIALAVAMCFYASSVGSLIGAWMVPKPGDATAEFLASGGVMLSIALLGNWSSSMFGDALPGSVATLTLAGCATLVLAAKKETARWRKHSASTRGAVA